MERVLAREERVRFVAQLRGGEPNGVCRAFGISRKTDYKILERYKEHGPRLERLNRHWDWRRFARSVQDEACRMRGTRS